jgi:prepilin-type N-terminal cleavage/methylation domain-containing protein
MNNFLRIKKGFSLIEVILSVSLLGLIAVSFGSVLVYNQQGSRIAGDRSRAALLAEEGLEAVRNIRDAGFSGIVAGTYSLTSTGNKWGLSTTYPETIDIFRRKIDITDLSADRKRVVSTVGWTDNGNYREVVETTYLNNWMKSGLSDWSSISIESGISLSGTNGIDVVTEGNYAYILRAVAQPYFTIVDITDPSNPTVVGSCPNSNCTLSTSLQDVVVSGDYAYVTSTNNNAELQIIDISDKANPRRVGVYNAPGTQDANGLFYANGLLYMTRNYSGTSGQDEFYIMNVSDPTNPVVVDSLSLEDNALDVVVSGNYAYLASADNSREFQVINVSNPANISLTGRYALNITGTGNNYNATTLAVGSGYAYVGRVTENRIYAVNISNPTAPTLVSASGYGVSGTAYGLALFNNDSYLAVSSNHAAGEIKVLNVSNPAGISQLSVLAVSGTFNGFGICYSDTKDRLIAVGSPTIGNSNRQMIIIKPQ